jgi:phosphonate transport system substrate-binding protein
MMNRSFFLPVWFALLGLMPGGVMSETAPEPYPVIKVGVGIETQYDTSVTDTEIVFKKVMNTLLEKIDEQLTAKAYDNSEILIEDFKEGKIDVIVIDSLNFLELDGVIPLDRRFLVQLGPSLKQRFLILARNKGKDTTLPGLRGGKLSIGGGRKVGKRFLDVTLLQRGLPISDHFFGEVDTGENINTAIIDLYFGKIDAAVVPRFGYELALELNPQLGREIKILATSESVVNEMVGVRHDFPQERLDRIRPLFLNLPPKRIELLFSMFHITGFHVANDGSLREVRELNKRYQDLVGQER